MYQVIIAIHVLLGLGIVGLVMMQQGKGAEAGASFGSGSAGSVFGAQGASSFLSRTTAILATLFFITSLSLAVINGRKGPNLDIMSTPVAEKVTDTPNVPVAPSIPAVEAPVQTEETVKPPSISQTAPVVVPVAPVGITPKVASQPEPAKPTPVEKIEKIEVPKAEPIKSVAEEKIEKKAAAKPEKTKAEKAKDKKAHKSDKKHKSDKDKK